MLEPTYGTLSRISWDQLTVVLWLLKWMPSEITLFTCTFWLQFAKLTFHGVLLTLHCQAGTAQHRPSSSLTAWLIDKVSFNNKSMADDRTLKDTAGMCMGHWASSQITSDQSLWRNRWNTYQQSCNSTATCVPQPTGRLSLGLGVLKHSTAAPH